MEHNCQLVDPRLGNNVFSALHTVYHTAKGLVAQYGNVRVMNAESIHRPAGICILPNMRSSYFFFTVCFSTHTDDRVRGRTEISRLCQYESWCSALYHQHAAQACPKNMPSTLHYITGYHTNHTFRTSKRWWTNLDIPNSHPSCSHKLLVSEHCSTLANYVFYQFLQIVIFPLLEKDWWPWINFSGEPMLSASSWSFWTSLTPLTRSKLLFMLRSQCAWTYWLVLSTTWHQQGSGCPS